MILLTLACVQNGLIGPEEVIEVPVRELIVSPTEIDFGSIHLGAQRTEVFTLESTGTSAVTLDGLTLSGPSSFDLAWLGEGAVLQPGESIDVVVDYTASSLFEEATIDVRSNAVEPFQQVWVEGTAIAPLLQIDPAAMDLDSPDGSPRTDDFILRSVGTETLVISDLLLLGDPGFSMLSGEPTSLEPGEELTVTIEWVPQAEYETAELWVVDNTPLGSAMAPITGRMPPPCLGLAEAWNIGSLYARVDSMGVMILENQDPDLDICIDRWTVWFSTDTQDMALGDQGFDPGGDYPTGSLVLGPGDTHEFRYGVASGNAWYCIEQTQLTRPTDNWMFFGARAPSPILARATAHSQDAVWAYEASQPVPVVGRDTNAVVPGDTVVLRSTNIGRRTADFELTETLPAGWTATDWSTPPDREWVNSDSSTTWAWDISLAAAIDTGEDLHTMYDWSVISYTLELEGADCKGRVYLEEPEAWWTDLSGDAQTSLGSPLLVTCD